MKIISGAQDFLFYVWIRRIEKSLIAQASRQFTERQVVLPGMAASSFEHFSIPLHHRQTVQRCGTHSLQSRIPVDRMRLSGAPVPIASVLIVSLGQQSRPDELVGDHLIELQIGLRMRDQAECHEVLKAQVIPGW